MSGNSDDEYASADENTTDDKLLKQPEHSDDSQTVHNDIQTVNKSADDSASSAQDQQPEVVKVLDNKYVSDAESLKNGGVVELTEEQRKVSTCLFSVFYPLQSCRSNQNSYTECYATVKGTTSVCMSGQSYNILFMQSGYLTITGHWLHMGPTYS